jgi:hypothetical protein
MWLLRENMAEPGCCAGLKKKEGDCPGIIQVEFFFLFD